MERRAPRPRRDYSVTRTRCLLRCMSLLMALLGPSERAPSWAAFGGKADGLRLCHRLPGLTRTKLRRQLAWPMPTLPHRSKLTRPGAAAVRQALKQRDVRPRPPPLMDRKAYE